MICLLCYECNSDLIPLSSVEAIDSKISLALFKYFRFMFEDEPVNGEICRKCWMKVEMFHTFYQRIEEIQTTVVKIDPLIVENLDVRMKIEENNSNTAKSNNSEQQENIHEFDDSNWHDESDSFSETFAEQINTNCDATKSTETKDNLKSSSKNSVSKTKSNKKTHSKKIVQCRKSNKPTSSDSQTCLVSKKCTKTFKTKDALIAHCAMDHKRFHCTHCPNVKLFADLYKHLRDVHGIIENAICEHCGQIFGCNRTLQDHINRKHTVNEPLQCDICKEWFKSREIIRSHMNYVHIQGPQTCGICGKVSANRKALRTHLIIHSEAWKDRFKCIACGKGFRSTTKLREHSYIHSGKTDAYICQFCGKAFRFSSSASAHRMKYHPAEMAHVKERLQRKRNMEFKV